MKKLMVPQEQMIKYEQKLGDVWEK